MITLPQTPPRSAGWAACSVCTTHLQSVRLRASALALQLAHRTICTPEALRKSVIIHTVQLAARGVAAPGPQQHGTAGPQLRRMQRRSAATQCTARAACASPQSPARGTRRTERRPDPPARQRARRASGGGCGGRAWQQQLAAAGGCLACTSLACSSNQQCCGEPHPARRAAPPPPTCGSHQAALSCSIMCTLWGGAGSSVSIADARG